MLSYYLLYIIFVLLSFYMFYCRQDFYLQDALDLAPELLRCYIIRNNGDNLQRCKITEVEIYRGEEDLACHACKGRTNRTETMYRKGGYLYVYLVYGIHWMLNIVSGKENEPQALLIRGIEGISGPGRVSRYLGIDKSFNGESLMDSRRIWLEKSEDIPRYITTPRIGIDYAGEPWKSKLWRFIAC